MDHTWSRSLLVVFVGLATPVTPVLAGYSLVERVELAIAMKEKGGTPGDRILFQAVKEDGIESVAKLCIAGFNVHAVDGYAQRPLGFAISKEMMDVLESAGARYWYDRGVSPVDQIVGRSSAQAYPLKGVALERAGAEAKKAKGDRRKTLVKRFKTAVRRSLKIQEFLLSQSTTPPLHSPPRKRARGELHSPSARKRLPFTDQTVMKVEWLAECSDESSSENPPPSPDSRSIPPSPYRSPTVLVDIKVEHLERRPESPVPPLDFKTVMPTIEDQGNNQQPLDSDRSEDAEPSNDKMFIAILTAGGIGAAAILATAAHHFELYPWFYPEGEDDVAAAILKLSELYQKHGATSDVYLSERDKVLAPFDDETSMKIIELVEGFGSGAAV